MTLAVIAIDSILVEQRLREVSEAQVESLAASIGDVGLLNPITVYPRELIRGGATIAGYGLVAGAHRIEACKRLGLVEIDASIVTLSDLERQIAECDENLCGTKLSPAEKAMFTRRRKQAYEALHPETVHGANQHSRSSQIGDSSAAERFTADTAKKTGHSETAVQRDAERGKKISERALDAIRGTRLDKGVYLDKLKSVAPEKQVEVVKADLAQSNISRRIAPKSAPAPLSEEETREKWLAAGMSWWNRAPQDWRDEFLARIDTPVFDRSAA